MADNAGRDACDDRAGLGERAVYDGIGSDVTVVCDFDVAVQDGAGTDVNVIADAGCGNSPPPMRRCLHYCEWRSYVRFGRQH